jgi:hypothetical protein
MRLVLCQARAKLHLLFQSRKALGDKAVVRTEGKERRVVRGVAHAGLLLDQVL